MATPALNRFPAREQEFCEKFGATPDVLARIRMEPSFLKDVVKESAPWVKQFIEIKNAVLKNALDSSRDDQYVWMKRYAAMAGLAGELPEEGEE